MAKAGGVLIIVENLPVPFDRRVWMEATTLQQAGYEVSVICPAMRGYEASYERLEGVHVHRHPLPPEGRGAAHYLREYRAALSWELRIAQRIYAERGFDVVHVCNPPDLLFLVATWFKLVHGTAIIFDQHDLTPEMYLDKYDRKDLFYRAVCLSERMTYSVADAVIAPNESYREIALQRGGFAEDEVFVVRSGPDLDRFRPLPPDPSHRRGRKHLVGYLGVMGEQDGVDNLLRAIRHGLDRGRADVQYMIMGDGPALQGLQALAIELGISGHVEFTGRVSGDDMLRRISSCDVGICPDPKTPYSDRCTMNKILEFLALGKPMVQFDLLEGRRSAGPASLYAAPNDPADLAAKLLHLLDEDDLRRHMGQMGRRRIEEKFAWKHQVPALLAAYRQVLGARAPQPARPVGAATS